MWPTHFWLFNQRFYFHLTKAIIKQFNISPATRTYKKEQFSFFVVKPVINLSFRRERPKRLSLLYTAIDCTKPHSPKKVLVHICGNPTWNITIYLYCQKLIYLLILKSTTIIHNLECRPISILLHFSLIVHSSICQYTTHF